MEGNMKVARFNYHHGCSLYIDNKYVCETEEWVKEDGEYDFEACVAFLKEQGVTHVIDEETFDDNVNANDEWDPQPHPLQEWADFDKA